MFHGGWQLANLDPSPKYRKNQKSSLAMTERMGWPKTRWAKPFLSSVCWLVGLLFLTCKTRLVFSAGVSSVSPVIRVMMIRLSCTWPLLHCSYK